MLTTNDRVFFRRLQKAIGAFCKALFSTYPMFILGWLISAIARHPIADKQISEEPVYKFLMWWQGGINSFQFFFMLILALTILIIIYRFLVKSGYGEPINGMEVGRNILRIFLMPAFLSIVAFTFGVLGGDSLSNMRYAANLILPLLIFSAMIFYFTEISDDCISECRVCKSSEFANHLISKKMPLQASVASMKCNVIEGNTKP